MPVGGGVTIGQILDLTRTTIENKPWDGRFTIGQELQRFPALDGMWREEKMEVEGGTSIDRYLMLDDSGTARWTRPYQNSEIQVRDTLTRMNVAFTQGDEHWAINKTEKSINRGAEAFLSMVKLRRVDAKKRIAKLLELSSWRAPDNASDDLNLMGVPYWIVPRAAGQSDSEGSFSGTTVRFGDGTTSTTTATVDRSTWELFRNWTITYDEWGMGVIDAMHKTLHRLGFEPAQMVAAETANARRTMYERFRLYAGQDFNEAYHRLIRRSNTDLGKDLAFADMRNRFYRIPMESVPALDPANNAQIGAYYPCYFIDHDVMKPVVRQGDWMVENEPMVDVTDHRTVVVFIDFQCQMLCDDVRRCGILHQPIPA